MAGISSATALLIAGGASSAETGVGKIMQGSEQQKAYDYNAAITTLNTNNAVVSNQDKVSKLTGQQATAYAASGVDIASGSPLLIMAATAARGGTQGEQIEQSGTEEAAMQRYYGKMAAFNGITSGVGGFLNGVTTDIAGYGKATSNPSPTTTYAPDPGFDVGGYTS